MRVVFMGTPDIAATCLKALLADDFEIVGVYTKPDKPKNRGMKLEMSEVKKVALAAGLPVLQPTTFRDDAVVEELRALRPDAIAVVAYGKILPQRVLDIPPLGCVNIHASILPELRGAAEAAGALMIFDLDKFKQINDTYGHIAGDDALQYFASKMRSFSRSFDGWVGRFGGDEFVLCAPKGLSEGDLERLFAEIDAIERHAFQAEAGSFSLAASCGVCFVRPDDTVRSLLDRADVAMYRAKESGRRWVER